MHWLQEFSDFCGGAVLANSVPHLAQGLAGRAFQTPFARPRGEGTSSSTVNALWGCFNLLLAFLLIGQVGDFDLRNALQAGALWLGFSVAAVLLARRFGPFNGGEQPGKRGDSGSI